MTDTRKRTSIILLVEDNPDDVELTRMALAESGIANRVFVAADGPEAIDFLHASGKQASRDPALDPALVLLDLKLPKYGGLEVLRRMRADERTRTTPVVILSTSSEREDIAASYRLGANSYVRKPVEYGEFAAAVRRLGEYWLLLNEAPIP